MKPFTWVFILLCFSIISKNSKTRKLTLASAFAILLLFSNIWLFNRFAKLYEAPYPILKHYDVGILLGGFSGVNEAKHIEFTSAGDRILQTIALYKQGVIQKILVSSGSANLFENDIKEANLAADYLRIIGIPDSAIVVENQSRNTKENISNSYQLILKENLGSSVLIITSAWHIPRTRLIVRQQGVAMPDFYPTHHLSGDDLNWSDYIIPSAEAVNNWGILIKEWIGYVVTKIRIT